MSGGICCRAMVCLSCLLLVEQACVKFSGVFQIIHNDFQTRLETTSFAYGPLALLYVYGGRTGR